MPGKKVRQRAIEDLKEGKSPSTAAGEFFHEEIEHVREGKHGARSPQQAIAIGLSKARRAGVPLAAPKGKVSEATHEAAERDLEQGRQDSVHRPSVKRSQASEEALSREPKSSASHRSLSIHASSSARKRGPASRSAAAEKSVATKGESGLRAAAWKAARAHAKHA